ncbi:hypothetical protein [Streptomyces coerulescens]|uniref:Uncharacterized protein n=1 Tax=Streptomyces coerulescens TaxID=29304 RepID=A0ABW0CMQ7_STRCD
MTASAAESPGESDFGTQGGGGATLIEDQIGEVAARSPSNAALHKQAFGKLGMWFLFAVIFAVLPTLGEWLNSRQFKEPTHAGFFELAARADLYVVSMGLAASAISQALMRKRGSFPPALKFWSSVNVLALALTAFLAATADSSEMDPRTVGSQSFIILISTLVSAGSSTYICERENL